MGEFSPWNLDYNMFKGFPRFYHNMSYIDFGAGVNIRLFTNFY